MKRSKLFLLPVLTVLIGIGCMARVPSAEAADSTLKHDVIELIRADVSDQVIISFIKTQQGPSLIGAKGILELKKAGASEAVLLAVMEAVKATGGGGSGGEYPFDLDEKHSVGKPIVEGLLAVYPIYRKGPTEVGTYLTLDEATDRKIIEIREKGSGSVPVVTIINNGHLPIYISAGEVIIGGKQDRMVAYDILIKPGKTVTVDVRCVEQGRWNNASKNFSSSKFMGGKRTRVAVQFKGQQDVWKEVAAQNGEVGARSSTGSYQASINSDKFKKSTQKYCRRLLPGLKGRNVVGMIVAINGKVHAIDIFGAPGMFSKMKEKLLKSYILDTIGTKDAKKSPPTKDAILKFYKKTMSARKTALKKYKYNGNFKRETREAIANDSYDVDGEILHRSLLAH